MASPLKITDKGCLIKVRLTPGSSSDEIVGIEEDLLGEAVLRAKVRAIPEKGKANKALIKLFSKSFGLPKSAFEVISGHTSRLKTVLVIGGEDEDLKRIRKALSRKEHD